MKTVHTDEKDIPKHRFLSHLHLCLIMGLNTIAVVLCTVYEELKVEVPVITSGQRHRRAELLCLLYFANLCIKISGKRTY